jgi:hypothetical protein
MRSVFAILLLPILTACDPIYGVTRRAKVGFMPDPLKVRSIVQQVPGVQEVRYEATAGGKPITLGGVQPATAVHTFFYSGGSNVRGVLQFQVDYHNRVEYSQTLIRMFEPPPQQLVDATLPVMKQIELRLEARAGLSGLHNSAVQWCDRVICR